MSSSVEFPDWSIFAEREVPFDIELLSPASEVAATLQQSQAALDGARQAVKDVHAAGLMALAQQAVLVVQLEAELDRYAPAYTQASLAKAHRALRIIKDKMLDELAKTGLEIIIPLGKTFEEVAHMVDVDGWRHHANFSVEVVAEVVEPIVIYHGDLVRPGRVVMGAPLQEVITVAATNPEVTTAVAATTKVEASLEGREE